MRLLFLVLWRNNFTLLFLLLLSFCFYLMVKNSKFQQASVLNASNATVAGVQEGVNYVKEYMHLKVYNEQLAKENAMLQNKLIASKYQYITEQNRVIDSALKQEYSYITAKVINNSINKRNNY